MISRDAVILIDLNGEEHFLTKLQVRTMLSICIFIHYLTITRWGWWCWLAGWHSCWPGCPPPCSTRLTLPAWRAAPSRSSSSTCLERRSIFMDTKVTIGNHVHMKSNNRTLSELFNTKEAVKKEDRKQGATSMVKKFFCCCCRGIMIFIIQWQNFYKTGSLKTKEAMKDEKKEEKAHGEDNKASSEL